MKHEFAERMKNLGTETAFEVGKETSKLDKQGCKIYPFHLGDLNIETPKNIREALVTALEKHTNYCPPEGIKELREALAKDVGRARGLELKAENVSIQPAGKPVIGKFIQILMNPGDEVLYPNPGYPLYESWIDFLGGIKKPYRMKETSNGFAIDMEQLKESITNKTKIFVYVNHQNPTGARSSKAEIEELAEMCIARDLYVLSDEAYFDIVYDGKKESIASIPGMFDRTTILYTFSKKYAMTGWRLGAAIGREDIINEFNRLNVNIESCTNHFVQWAGIEALTGPQIEVENILRELEQRRDVAVSILETIPGFKVYKPECTFYLFPNVREVMKNMKIESGKDGEGVEKFRQLILRETGVSFCTRNHFGTRLPDEEGEYIRLAYSGINSEDIKESLGKLKEFIEKFQYSKYF